MNTRRATIKSAYLYTCCWLTSTPAWQKWLSDMVFVEHLGLFWIYGKPGSGKSTMMRFLYDQTTKDKVAHEIVISFFFHARGEILEKSTTGLYRSLLYQLLNIDEAYQTLFNHVFPSDFSAGDTYLWDLDTLCETLHKVIIRLLTKVPSSQSRTKTLKIFIDALDECSEPEIVDMVRFLRNLGRSCVDEGAQLRVCFASRHYPAVEAGPGIQMDLDLESGHQNDITSYIQQHLRSPSPDFDIRDVQQVVQEKARGVFLWVQLVVDILCKEIKNGRIHTIQRRLREIPPRLSDLIMDIMRRDDGQDEEFKFCLQLILFARRPLRCEEFYIAMLAGTDPDFGDLEIICSGSIAKGILLSFLLSASKGLAQLTRPKELQCQATPTVQFIHESIRDKLLKEKGFLTVWPDLREPFEVASHDHIRQCCENYLDLVARTLPLTRAYIIDDFDLKLDKKYPFLSYALANILYHADAAAQTKDCTKFITEFDWKSWTMMHNLVFFSFGFRHYATDPDLTYIFASKNCARLLTLIKPTKVWKATRSIHAFKYAFCVAMATRNREAAGTLLRQSGISDATVAKLQFPASDMNVYSRHMTPLLALCCGNNEDIILELLKITKDMEKLGMGEDSSLSTRSKERLSSQDVLFPTDTFYIEESKGRATISAYRRMIKCASALEQHDRVRRILSTAPLNIDMAMLVFESVDDAMRISDTSTLEILLSHERALISMLADRIEVDSRLFSLLSKAAQHAPLHIMRIILKYSAAPALLTAIRHQRHELLRSLLQMNTSPAACLRTESSPLFIAIEVGDLETIGMLLNAGADRDLYDVSAAVILVNMAWNQVHGALALVNKNLSFVKGLLIDLEFLALWWLCVQLACPSTMACHCIPCETLSGTYKTSPIADLELRDRLGGYDDLCLLATRHSPAVQSSIVKVLSETYRAVNDTNDGGSVLDSLACQEYDKVLDLIESTIEQVTKANSSVT